MFVAGLNPLTSLLGIYRLGGETDSCMKFHMRSW